MKHITKLDEITHIISFARHQGARSIDIAKEILDAVSYSTYTDPRLFPRFGGDGLDPPAYSADRKGPPYAGMSQ